MQPALPPPSDGHRDGVTYEAPFDYTRLNRQARLVWDVMKDFQWRSLTEIAALTGQPEASISARLRDFRKPKYGHHEVQRRRIEGSGLFRYRLAPRQESAA